jgi:hypothetical protein
MEVTCYISKMSSRAPYLISVALLLAVNISGCSDSNPAPSQPAAPQQSAKRPQHLVLVKNAGDEIDLKKILLEGDVNVLFFYSPAVTECVQMEEPIRKLATSRPDLIIHRIDIDRPETTAPDYQSPVARQFAISKVPNFKIYDLDGDLVTTDSSATAMMKQWMLPKKPAR